MANDVLLLVIALVIGLLIFKRGKRPPNNLNYPPGPICLPLIGSAYAMGTDRVHVHISFLNLAKKWGPIFRLKVGPTPIVVISDPEIIRKTFHGSDSPVLRHFASETTRQAEENVSLMFNESRTRWAALRKIYHPIIRNLPDGTTIPQVILEQTNKLLAALDKYNGKEVVLNPLFMFFTRNVFLRLTISKTWSFDTQDSEEQAFNGYMNGVKDNWGSIADFIPALDFLAWKSRRLVIKNARNSDGLILREIAKRAQMKTSKDSPKDLLDLLLLEREKDPEFTEAAMLHSFRNMIFAGTMTVSDGMDWMVLFLSTHQDIQEKCYKEISAHLQGREPTPEDQSALPYLDSILKETLRLRPPAPLALPHLAEEDCTIAGYFVEKGTVVMQNIYGIGNSERIFKNASEFDPDRWQREPHLAADLLTFGHGPTICLGVSIAKQELFLAAASILQRYKFEVGPSSPSPDFVGEFKVTFNPKPWKTLLSIR